MLAVQFAAVNCVSCERCRVETIDSNGRRHTIVWHPPEAHMTGLGVHARPAAKLTQLASTFDSEISLLRRGRRVSAKSIMGVMMLDICPGTIFEVQAEGHDEAAAVTVIASLLYGCFGEGLKCPDFGMFLDARKNSRSASPPMDESPDAILAEYALDLRRRGSCLHGLPYE